MVVRPTWSQLTESCASMQLSTCDAPITVGKPRHGYWDRVLGWRVIMLGLGLGAILAFAAGRVAECSIAVDAGSYSAASVAGPAHSHAGSEKSTPNHSIDDRSELSAPARTGPAVGQCHHGSDHQHKGAASKIHASSPRAIDHVSATIDFGGLDWSAAGAVVLLGLGRRSPPSSVSRSCPSGRHILISCIART